MGSATQVGGGPGGFYTQAEYAEIVRYAQERYISIVPEIDMPGHTNAALIGHPELSCSRMPPAPYTGTEVGWSTFCPNKEETYALIDDIVRELAALTPGRYFHMGGDEVEVLTHDEYIKFVERVQEIVVKHGKEMIGWEEVGKARLRPTTLVQQWKSDSAVLALRSGAKLIMSPAKRAYLDMKYTPGTELGLTLGRDHRGGRRVQLGPRDVSGGRDREQHRRCRRADLERDVTQHHRGAVPRGAQASGARRSRVVAAGGALVGEFSYAHRGACAAVELPRRQLLSVAADSVVRTAGIARQGHNCRTAESPEKSANYANLLHAHEGRLAPSQERLFFVMARGESFRAWSRFA